MEKSSKLKPIQAVISTKICFTSILLAAVFLFCVLLPGSAFTSALHSEDMPVQDLFLKSQIKKIGGQPPDPLRTNPDPHVSESVNLAQQTVEDLQALVLQSQQDTQEARQLIPKLQENVQAVIQKANESEGAIKPVLQLSQNIEPLGNSVRASASQAEQVANDTAHSVIQALQSPQQIQNNARSAVESVKLIDRLAGQAREKINTAKASVRNAEGSFRDAERLARDARRPKRYAGEKTEDLLSLTHKAQVSAQKVQSFVDRSQQPTDKMKALATQAQNSAQQATGAAAQAQQLNLQAQQAFQKTEGTIVNAQAAIEGAKKTVQQSEDDLKKIASSRDRAERETKKFFVPELVRSTVSEAIEKLERRNMNWIQIKVKPNLVVDQDPGHDRRKPILSPVKLTIMVESMSPQKRRVPNVTNHKLADAIRELEENSLCWKVVKINRNKVKNPPRVLKQRPRMGAFREVNNPVELVVTKSSNYGRIYETEVPDVEMKSLEEAKELLRRQDFGYKVKEKLMDGKPGKVVGQSPDAGNLRPADGTVELFVRE